MKRSRWLRAAARMETWTSLAEGAGMETSVSLRLGACQLRIVGRYVPVYYSPVVHLPWLPLLLDQRECLRHCGETNGYMASCDMLT
jgi:hypothetical protein